MGLHLQIILPFFFLWRGVRCAIGRTYTKLHSIFSNPFKMKLSKLFELKSCFCSLLFLHYKFQFVYERAFPHVNIYLLYRKGWIFFPTLPSLYIYINDSFIFILVLSFCYRAEKCAYAGRCCICTEKIFNPWILIGESRFVNYNGFVSFQRSSLFFIVIFTIFFRLRTWIGTLLLGK